MDKQQIISLIQGQLENGKISKADLMTLINDSSATPNNTASNFIPVPPQQPSSKEENSKNLIHTFYGIGAMIVLVGVIILISQNWTQIGFSGRVSVTLGISLVTYVLAFFLYQPSQRMLSQVMFTISAALAPLGIYVLLHEANINFVWPYTFFSACLLFLIFGAACLVNKKNILILITIGFASWAYFSFLLQMFPPQFNSDLLKWATMLWGFSYILISYGYKSIAVAVDSADGKEKKAIQNVLYGFGTLAILGSGILVGGFFDIIFIALIFVAFYASVYLKSQSMLLFGALFLMAHIIKLTSKYFVNSVGWPVSLIFVGFFVIGVGYVTYYLNKNFIIGK